MSFKDWDFLLHEPQFFPKSFELFFGVQLSEERVSAHQLQKFLLLVNVILGSHIVVDILEFCVKVFVKNISQFFIFLNSPQWTVTDSFIVGYLGNRHHAISRKNGIFVSIHDFLKFFKRKRSGTKLFGFVSCQFYHFSISVPVNSDHSIVGDNAVDYINCSESPTDEIDHRAVVHIPE